MINLGDYFCSAKVRESIFQDLVDQGKQPMNENIWTTNTLNHPIPSNISKAPIRESSPLHITSEVLLIKNGLNTV